MPRALGRLLIAAGTLLLLSIGAGLSSHAHIAHWREYACGLLVISLVGYWMAEKFRLLSQYYESELVPNIEIEPGQRPLQTLRGLAVITSIFALSFAYIALTGGLSSPYFFVLFQPITLLTLRYGARAGLVASVGLALAYLWGPDYRAWALSPSHVAAAISFPAMALFAALITSRLRRAGRLLAKRISDLDSLLDVSRMLETALDLKTTVNLILLTVPETVPFSRCAIYLLDSSEGVYKLQDYVPRHGDEVLLPTITLCDHARDRRQFSEDSVLAFDRSKSTGLAGNVLGVDQPVYFDPVAESHAYATMRSADGVVGLLCLARAKGMGSFTRKECLKIGKYAAHVGLNLQQALYRDRLEHLAFEDTMTGLANYRYFERRLGEELSRCTRYGHPLTVVMLDIDYFKVFNDTWGHKAGDAILAQFGVVLRNTLRDTDIPARSGGEEFVVICPETTADRASQICERLREAISTNIFTLPGKNTNETATAHITASVGYATFPTDAYSGEVLVRLADLAFFAAKAAGRNRAVHGDAETPEADLATAVNG